MPMFSASFEVSFPIADHPAVFEVQFTGLQIGQNHADAGLAVGRVFMIEVRIDQDMRLKSNALRFEKMSSIFCLRNLGNPRWETTRCPARPGC